MARGVFGEIRSDCRLVLEKTSVWDDTGMSSCLSTERRYPLPFTHSNLTVPLSIFVWRSAVGLDASPAIGIRRRTATRYLKQDMKCTEVFPAKKQCRKGESNPHALASAST